ncbi:hypothetical protein PFICI_13721 [Pestalotiopsis fici W106-1]|uniref:Uncharacterized protein n=1 Tax=Pestalotiopsis fici (strain W106-1 / CGMCC3.15140) TaxID=1229662 RepID=W3WQ35_PESFW|nr:uncharacterized protein PFICI_13721 [Pestalotiopsis fici W106-1]ETS75237.1 hypothetical protein PFICI_13721 [Pestalotiopsis fici W106-1]
MSWMDSWSRPSKTQATPAPYYLLPGGENTPYCHSCGRVIGQRKTNAAATAKTEAKYCSSKCRSHRPGKLDREIESAFVRLLEGSEELGGPADAHTPIKAAKKHKGRNLKLKGDQRILVRCSVVEGLVFGTRDEGADEENHSTRSGSSEPEIEHHEHRPDTPVDHLVESSGQRIDELGDEDTYVDGDVLARLSIRSGTRIRPAQDVSEVNGSVGGEKGKAERIEENEEMLKKRRLGQRRAKEKEMVKCAARRGVVFGFLAGDQDGAGQGGGDMGGRRKCEAVSNGNVVEPSFAKGDWQIRWRE